MQTQQLSAHNSPLSTVEDLHIVIVGHVDHGKSTIVGRLLADTDSLPEGKLERVRETCRRNAKPFEYAFLLDALKDEQAQGITIDSARCFFKTAKRNYILIDAPGHVEFLKNMVTGASRAEAALLVIDAHEGIRENSRRHGYLLAMLGIRQITVLVNKMDLVDYRPEAYWEIVAAYTTFLTEIGVEASRYIPVSGFFGGNIASQALEMPWYQGPTVLETLDGFSREQSAEEKPFRMPVQGVYKFTRNGDDRRIVAGTIDSGRLKVNDEIVFYPSGKRSQVKSLEVFNQAPPSYFVAGQAVGFTLTEQIYIKRGDLAVLAHQEQPKVTSRLRVNLFWLRKEPLVLGRDYGFKLGTAKVKMRLERIVRVLDAATLQTVSKNQIDRHEVAECILELESASAFDVIEDNPLTSRFVIVDQFEISGGGIITEALEDKQSLVRERVMLRNFKWEKSNIAPEERAQKYNQKATLILLTGSRNVGKKALAKALEQKLFSEGKIVYFLGIGNVLYGVDADIKNQGSNNYREEHLRRLAEVSHLLLDAGVILIVTAVELNQEDLEIIKTVIDAGKIETVWVGEKVSTDIAYDLHLPVVQSKEVAVATVKERLQMRGVIYRPG